ncbi:MAG: rRNA ((1402)-N(4))-methyltransferase [Alphaproteobacteria bacterium]|nr:rRNA ((1402)-N(4))-methyltransferase [Alphaproteobacteria bacterium]
MNAAGHTHPTQTTDVAHRPVLLSEVIDALALRDGGIYVDGTFGAGGYSRAMLDAAACSVFGIDRDPTAIASGQTMVRQYDGRLTLLEGCYGDMDQLLASQGVDAVDGIALDLGVSSMQFDQAERGFSFRFDGPLDMRMGNSGLSAADIVNTWDEKPLADLIFRYGEERHSRRIARAIVRERATAPITRTVQLAEIVRRAIPRIPGRKEDRIDPATRTFQALRIAVNDELGELERGLAAAQKLLRQHGRLAVVSFHSLEDRIVKDFMRERSDAAPRPSRHMPEIGRKVEAPFRLVSRRPILPNETETALNIRARSAKLRVAEATGVASQGGRA